MTCTRSLIGVADQAGNASVAARIAASTSPTEESGTRERRLPSLGLTTSSTWAWPETKRPPITLRTEGNLGAFRLPASVTGEAIGLPTFVAIRIAPVPAAGGC